MSEVAFMEILKNVGPSALFFAVFYIYHKGQTKVYDRQMQLYEDVIKSNSVREERNFEILKEMTEAIQYLGNTMSRVEQKIEGNRWCPITKDKEPK